MFSTLLQQLKYRIVTLRFSILSIFVVLFVTSISVIIYMNYLQASRDMLFTANQLMHEVSTSLYRELTREINAATRDSEVATQIIQNDVINLNDLNEVAEYTYHLANRFYLVQAAHWGDAKGNAVIASYEPDDSLTTEIYNRMTTPPTGTIIKRDINGNVISKTQQENFQYDPRMRPWYLLGQNARKTAWTDIYPFEPTKHPGITLATPVFKNNGKLIGVFGLDIRLDWLSWYVGLQKISENGIAFIVTSDGEVAGYPGYDQEEPSEILPDIHSIAQPGIAKSFDVYKKTGKPEFSFEDKGETYLAVYKLIPNFAMNNWLIGVVVPKDDFVGELKKTSMINFLISVLILFAGIALVSNLVTRLVRPLKKLVKETEKIKSFNLEDETRVRSRIKEIMALSNAVYNMKMGLKSFKRYVPSALVRQLIETGESVRIGGARRQLVVLFTDVKDFTTIAEKMNPDELMENMCEYFEVMTNVIIAEKGTIDKFIGDSVMAFWGAPLAVDFPAVRAAKAALLCVKQLNELNANWQMQEKPALETRFGIHIGEAVVGNVGSSERINYTALGDTVNTASRLEGVNKVYGTQIIVSEDMHELLKDKFVVRMIDLVAVKGKTKPEFIYELMAQDKKEIAFDIDAFNDIFAKGFSAYLQQQWDAAIELFKQCLNLFPGDPVAALFILRCQELKANPPLQWDGVWRLSEK